ncbi:MAG: InlB B-repeat-containing protein, partial [Candidatus Desulfacyla sp.]
SAWDNHTAGRYQNAVRDAYFACFHSFSSVLIDQGKKFKKHGDLAGTNNPANLIMDGEKSVTANFALTYTVTYNGNGSTGGTPPVDGNAYQQGDQVTVLGNAGGLVKTGNSFNNWNTASNGSGAQYAPGDSFNMPGANVTLYAQWSFGSTHYVCSDGECGGKTQCHRTVREAVEAAGTGTLIKIAAEEHDGNFSLSVDKALTLQGGWDKTFNNPNGGTTTLHGAPKAPQGSLTFQNLRIVP